METIVLVAIDRKTIWERVQRDGNPGGKSIRDKAVLTQVVALLTEALAQAEGELSCLGSEEEPA